MTVERYLLRSPGGASASFTSLLTSSTMLRSLSAFVALPVVALLAACGGFKSTWPSVTGVSAQTVCVSVNCMAEQAKTLGYDVRVVDHKRGIEATRNDTSDVRFVNEFRRFDVLSGTAKAREGEHTRSKWCGHALALSDAARHDAHGRAGDRRGEEGRADDRDGVRRRHGLRRSRSFSAILNARYEAPRQQRGALFYRIGQRSRVTSSEKRPLAALQAARDIHAQHVEEEQRANADGGIPSCRDRRERRLRSPM